MLVVEVARCLGGVEHVTVLVGVRALLRAEVCMPVGMAEVGNLSWVAAAAEVLAVVPGRSWQGVPGSDSRDVFAGIPGICEAGTVADGLMVVGRRIQHSSPAKSPCAK